MSVYNGERFLPEAIDSILGQTFADFEFIIVDDASTDATPAILSEYAKADSRIVLQRNDQNIGLTRSLNRGLEVARGEYLARMDADDVSLPHRLAAQVGFLDQYPDCVLLGTAYSVMSECGEPVKIVALPVDDVLIRLHMLFINGFGHPTVMFRLNSTRTAGLLYNPRYKQSQDYELWSRMLQIGKGANLAEPLVKYRQHPTQVSAHFRSKQDAIALEIAQRNLRRLGFHFDSREYMLVFSLIFDSYTLSRSEMLEAYILLMPLLREFSMDDQVCEAAISKLRRQYVEEAISLVSLRRLRESDGRMLVETLRCHPQQAFPELARVVGKRALRLFRNAA